jgi:hypothetical protein
LLRKYCKEGASVVTHFWVPAQKTMQKKKIKKIWSEEKNNKSEKRMSERPEND